MARKKTMAEYKDIIRRLRENQSIRGMQRETGIHRTIIRKIHKKAFRKGWLDPFVPLPSEEELEDCFAQKETSVQPLDAFKERIAGWVKKEYSYVVMHRLITREYQCSEATVRRYVKKNFQKRPKAVMVRPTVAGETMEVDFGYLGLTYDEKTGKKRKTHLFSGRLNHSRKTYREIVFQQKQETFFMCHVRAFEYFGGVPLKVVPDNLKAAVIKASFESPVINRVYQRLAEHYGFLINPCLPYHPEHKGGVENDVKYVKKNFWPVFCEEQRELGRETPSTCDIQQELDSWTVEVAETRIIGGVGRTVLNIFDTEEKSTLKRLPASRWEPLTWSEAKVQESFRIQFQNAFYSVPYAYIGKRVQVLATLTSVHIFLQHKEIAVHSLAEHRWQYVRRSEHAPPEPEKYMSMTRAGIIRQAEMVGRSTALVATAIFASKAIDGLRPARALLSFVKKYGPHRLEAACRRALAFESPCYASVKSILSNNLDRLDIDEPVEPSGQRLFAFARERGYFSPAADQNETGGKTHERDDIAQTASRAPQAVGHAREP